MATVNSARECPICLDKFRDPVVTPCGHVSCSACMKMHARGSSDPYEATCPTCRAPFPIVTPDMSIVPKKYHVFISPPLRRVFLGDSPVAEDSDAIEEGLRAEIAALNARVASLRRDKDLLMDRCEAAQSAVARLTSDERAARLARDKAREDAYLANVKFEKLRVEYDALKSRDDGLLLGAKAKRTRTTGQAVLDESPSCSTGAINTRSNGRVTKPMPKRAKLQPAHVVSSEQTVQQLPPPVLLNTYSRRRPSIISLSGSSASASSSSAPPSRFFPDASRPAPKLRALRGTRGRGFYELK